MSYFRIYHITDQSIIGTLPQINNPVFAKGYGSPYSLANLYFERSTEGTDIPEATVVPKAKLIDYMSASFLGNQPYLSNRLVNIFKAYSTEGLEFIPAVLYYKKKKVEGYSIMNSYLSAFHLLDYTACTFAYTDAMGRVELEQVRFNNAREVEDAFEQNQKDAIAIGYPNHRPLTLTSIAINSTCDTDAFAIKGCNFGGRGLFVSERLKDNIQAAGCTGMIFKALNESPY